MRDIIKSAVADSVAAVSKMAEEEGLNFITSAAEQLAACFGEGNKIIIAGNGGSLCDAMHFAEELTGQFRSKRRALPAIALCEPGHLTCVSNDMGFKEVFARGVEAYGKPGDIFVGLTTSGNSPNIVRAVEQAKVLGMKTIIFSGKSGGALKGLSDLEWIVEGFKTSDRIQEAHMAAIHIIIEMIEYKLFG